MRRRRLTDKMKAVIGRRLGKSKPRIFVPDDFVTVRVVDAKPTDEVMLVTAENGYYPHSLGYLEIPYDMLCVLMKQPPAMLRMVHHVLEDLPIGTHGIHPLKSAAFHMMQYRVGPCFLSVDCRFEPDEPDAIVGHFFTETSAIIGSTAFNEFVQKRMWE